MPTLLGAAAMAGAGYLWARATRHRPSTHWRDRVVVITGGARGLGFALAEIFAARGAIVWLVSRHRDELDRAVERLRDDGARAHAYAADVTDAASVAGMIDAVVARHRRLDAVVNNAGVITAMPFVNAEDSDFRESLDTHFWGPLHVVRAALPWLQRAHPGHVINISSIGGRVGVPHLAPYCAGKFALTGLSQVLRAELAAEDIWVTLATPGLMRTGSVGRVKVRGAHVAEARWFAALAATPLTAQDARAAARQIVNAAEARRAAVTPGWQARVQQAANAFAPQLTASVLEAVHARLLPAPASGPTSARAVSTLSLGWAAPLVSESTAVDYNQPEAAEREPARSS
jgi:NAD(P)-dependent dehydrogenase (short-subunit alcohol dehydrogenase family)